MHDVFSFNPEIEVKMFDRSFDTAAFSPQRELRHGLLRVWAFGLSFASASFFGGGALSGWEIGSPAISIAGAVLGFFLVGWSTIGVIHEDHHLTEKSRKRWASGLAWAAAFVIGFVVLRIMAGESQILFRVWVAGAVTGAIGGTVTTWLIHSGNSRRAIRAGVGGVVWSGALALNFYVVLVAGYALLSTGGFSALPMRILGWAIAGAIGGLLSSILGASQFVPVPQNEMKVKAHG